IFPEVGHELHAILDAADNQSPVNTQPVPLSPMGMRVQVSDPAQSQSRLLTGIWIGLALIAGWSAHFIMAKIRSRS
ncbi:MAG: hypothetical protein O3C21_04470, partial [Verrucomicrobia bacterium]|nr:hypothetical protein [Verrucomicrobiota bacterium]